MIRGWTFWFTLSFFALLSAKKGLFSKPYSFQYLLRGVAGFAMGRRNISYESSQYLP